jgi:hypothetical protein
MFVYSPDGVTVETAGALPSRFTRRTDGAWSIPTPETAEAFGWFPVEQVDRPAADPWDTVTVDVVHDGDQFVQRWTVTEGVPPLVDPTERPDEDEVAASIALLTEDSVGYRAVVGLLLAKGIVTQAEVGAAMAKATERLVVLADNPEVRRAMMAQRLAAAEALRDG